MSDVRLKEFAGTVYGAPGAQELLLDCQDRLGLDVLCLLSACWLGATERSLDVDGWRRLLGRHGQWRDEVIEPLRRARRAMKAIKEAEALYREVKQCELNAEWLALDWMEVFLADNASLEPGQAKAAAGRSLDAYCQAADVPLALSPETRTALVGLALQGPAAAGAPVH